MALGARRLDRVAAVGVIAAALVGGSVGMGAHGGFSAYAANASSLVSLNGTDVALSSQSPGSAGGSLSSMVDLAGVVGAPESWRAGITGAGVDVALVDSGIAAVDGLAASRIVNGPDLSSAGAAKPAAGDGYGHGTHMAGIIAGSDGSLSTGFTGVAPGARLINVKVAGADGDSDVPSIIAGIDWVVAHRNSGGRHIRVLNLSFGTLRPPPDQQDRLSAAVEAAWQHGIVVVAAAGNDGQVGGTLSQPAADPYVIAVGADDPNGTATAADDTVAAFSSQGNNARRADLVAPGTHVASLRDPGSAVDQDNPSARVGDRFFLGSGTSQAAAFVSGAAALLLQQRPDLTPDQVKALLTSTAAPIGPSTRAAGSRLLDIAAAQHAATPAAAVVTQRWAPVADAGSVTPAGATWSGATWSGATWSGATWSGATWSGATWSGATWSGATWSGATWSGATWSGATWS